MKKVFTRLATQSSATTAMRTAQDWFILMFLLRGLPFVDLAYLRKNDLKENVITYRRRKTGRTLSVTLTTEAMFLLQRYMNRDVASPYLFPILRVVRERKRHTGNISWHCGDLITSWLCWVNCWESKAS